MKSLFRTFCTTLFLAVSRAFPVPSTQHISFRHPTINPTSHNGIIHEAFFARNTKLQGRRGSRKGRSPSKTGNGSDDDVTDVSVENPKPNIPTPKTNQISISLERPKHNTYLKIYAYQVSDAAWWNHEENVNPFGARCWPSSMALANFLVCLDDIGERTVFEIGCGPGLPSLAAAYCGASVKASDVSSVALSLVRDGWKATATNSKTTITGTLSADYFDIFSNQALPIVGHNNTTDGSEKKSPIVIASAMMYDADLAVALARRVVEACNTLGAWVILGEDDTGQRDGGRNLFLDELTRLEGSTKKIQRVWTDQIVKNEKFGWKEKQVYLLHLNPPNDCVLPPSSRTKNGL